MGNVVIKPKVKQLESNLFRIPFIALLVISILFLAYITGGAPNTLLHLIYIPVILAAYYWGIVGGISVAAVSGRLAGPVMPLANPGMVIWGYQNWIIRFLILVFIGLITGYMFRKIDDLSRQEKERAAIDPFTGIYNTNKLMKFYRRK
ncbi:MAG: hypothetical protein ACOX5F_00360 [Anaerovoracaceae bacterium]|jgi:hypothetical protein